MKILIWLEKNEVKNTGGPSGYLWNLEKYLKIYNNENMIFEFKKKGKKKKKRFKLYRSIIKRFYNGIRRVEKLLNLKLKSDENIDINYLNSFDYIHFHSTLDIYKNKKFLNKFKGKVILTSHSPQLSSEEVLDKLEDNIRKNLEKKFIEKYKRYDYFAFERADYIIFPCKEAMEPYLKDLRIKNILENKFNKILFVPTGINGQIIKKDKNYFKEKFKIPENAYVITYIGRHNKIKGYDIMIEFGRQLLNKYEDIYFIIAGQQDGKIPSPINNRWIECGWTSEGLNIIKNCDLFILPNRETYFDLIFLEALSQNTTILCSDTGGNKFFKKYKSNKIFYFKDNNINDAINNFKYIYSNKEKIELSQDNKKIFENYFTVNNFGKNYIKSLLEIDEREKNEKI